MDSHRHHQQQQQQHLQHLQYLHHHQTQTQAQTQTQTQTQTQGMAVEMTAAGGDRFPQWSVKETKEMIEIRAGLDQTFMETKRNKLLWEVISNNMRDKGFLRSPEQCKCKWKNLVTRYKGCETMEPEIARQQFPFYDDMQVIFTERMQRMLWAEAEGGGGGGVGTSGATAKTKANSEQYSSDEEDENVNEEMVSEEIVGDVSNNPKTLNPRKSVQKKRKGGSGSNSSYGGRFGSSSGGMREVLEEFVRQQMRMEREWREAWEARERERAEKEEEWRRKMEELEEERVAMERVWQEREEQRRAREEARAEKRDALINALLAKFTREGSL